MPTPGERRALIFIASVGALGVAVRGWREFRPQDAGALAGNRTALAHQIEAVDSAIAVTSSKRKPRAPKVALPRADSTLRISKPSRGRAHAVTPTDTATPDPRQAYWDRGAHFDSVRQNIGRAAHEATASRPPSKPPSAFRRPPSQEKWSTPPVDLDVADMDEVASLPMIGAGLARRIVMDRIDNGPFGSILNLERVPGVTPAFAHRLAPFVTFSLAPRLESAGERRTRSKSERRPGDESRP